MEMDIAKKLIINYLKTIAHIKLKWKFKGQIISLGGCFGKSSAVNLLESIFSIEHKTYTTYQGGKGLNSESGVAFAILDIHPDRYRMIDWARYSMQALGGLFKKFEHQVFIIELGVDKPNDLKFLTSFIKPNLGILLNSNNTHSVNFEELQKSTNKTFEELIAYENGYLFETALDAIVYNLDDPEVVKQISRFKGETKIPFSLTNNQSIIKFKPSLTGTEIKFKYLGEKYSVTYPSPLLDEYRETFEMVIKVAEFYDLKVGSVVEGIKSYKLPASRCTLFEGIRGSYIVDSSYNSSYVPATSAIRLTKEISKGRKIAVLGDMRELGVLSEKEHRKLAHIAVENLDVVLTVGTMMMEYFKPEFEGKMKPEQKIVSFETTKEALEFVSKNNFEFIQKNDVVLVKGSQNTLLLETIVEALLQDKSNISKLGRRGKMYDAARQELLR